MRVPLTQLACLALLFPLVACNAALGETPPPQGASARETVSAATFGVS